MVARPGKWGNPYRVGALVQVLYENVVLFRDYVHDAETAVALYRQHLDLDPVLRARVECLLRGRDLACWCPLDRPCHADVLLEVANR